MFDETTLAPDDIANSEDTLEDQPTVDEAKKFITQVLGLPEETIKWDQLFVKEQRPGKPGWPDAFTFSTGERTKVSIKCTFSRGGDNDGFTDIIVSENQPIPNSADVWVKTFRIYKTGVVSLEVVRAGGTDFIVKDRVLSLPSDRPYVQVNGVEAPLGLEKMLPKEKELLLIHGVQGVLVNRGLMDNPKDFDPQEFPSVLNPSEK